jgi:hypothetical protein
MMERDLRQMLLKPTTTLRTTELNGTTLAWVDYEGKEVEVVLDPMRGGLIESLVHELIHAVYAKQLRIWGRNEECIVCALEVEQMHLVNNDESRVRWWRDAINAKLDKEAA